MTKILDGEICVPFYGTLDISMWDGWIFVFKNSSATSGALNRSEWTIDIRTAFLHKYHIGLVSK